MVSKDKTTVSELLDNINDRITQEYPNVEFVFIVRDRKQQSNGAISNIKNRTSALILMGLMFEIATDLTDSCRNN